MKKRFICLVLSLCMVVGVVTGCGSSEDALLDNAITSKESEDTSSNNVVTSKESEDALSDNVTVTQKLEEEYVERMEAYLAYYQSVKTDDIGIAITLDSEHLPLMWLLNRLDKYDYIVQLTRYEDGEVKTLAERHVSADSPNFDICPSLNYDAVVVGLEVDSHVDNYLFYDEDIKDFRYVSEEELVEMCGVNIIQDLGVDYDETRHYFMYVDDTKGEMAYVGYQVLDYSDYTSYSDWDDNKHGYLPFTIYDYNNEEIGTYEDILYFDLVYNEEYMSREDGDSYIDELPSCSTRGRKRSSFAEPLLVYLINHPAYTNGDLITALYALDLDYTVIDADTLDLDLDRLFSVAEDTE